MVVTVLSKAGDQVPVIPLSEVVGKAAIVVPAQTAAIGLKVGIVLAGVTTMVNAVETAHCPALGVNV